eukprot:GHVT01100734.1.p2 GENE.GHVT01100734.1~~GHVT01100734.1.p2  ORF type:complete len:165 (-),score=5.55 GHVT01100734.1:621-1115(-)
MLMGEADESISSSQHHGGRISQAGEKVLNLYTNNTGVTGVRFLNAPSLKGKICWPFVVVPSGKITRGDIASSSVEMSKFCRSAIARTALRLSSTWSRSTMTESNASASPPQSGSSRTLDFDTKPALRFAPRYMTSIIETWFATKHFDIRSGREPSGDDSQCSLV